MESDLENILEKNPDYFFKTLRVMIIGRQISTNFNTFIDLLGIDTIGNTVVKELKRGRTPRETELLTFRWHGDKAVFSGLDSLNL